MPPPLLPSPALPPAAAELSDNVTGVLVRLTRIVESELTLGNTLVLVPCLILAGPLTWIWWQLDKMGAHSGTEIWTATDADMREVDISTVGASGVALLRRRTDREFAILFSYVGIFLQTIFLYFIALYSRSKALAPTPPVAPKAVGLVGSQAPLWLIFCSLFCNSMTGFASIIQGLKAWNTDAPPGYHTVHRTLVMLDSFIIPSASIIVGSVYLCTSGNIAQLIFSATSMAFVCQINQQIAGLMSWSLSGHRGFAFQPGYVCIKDSVNSMRYASYSIVASAFVAVVMGLFGRLVLQSI